MPPTTGMQGISVRPIQPPTEMGSLEKLGWYVEHPAGRWVPQLGQKEASSWTVVLQILQNFLRFPEAGDDVIELFRKRLEEDVLWENSITEHCRKLNVNRDLLRQEFQTRYKIAPGEYRIQLRLRKICHLLAYSDLNLKEIAYEVGMKNLSHLSCFVKERCGKTPSELSREYRNKS